MKPALLPTLLLSATLTFSIGAASATDLVETASTAGSFKTFLATVKAAGMTDSLRTQGPFTVFAPSDEAFAKLPDGTVETMMKDKAKLAQLISHHIVPGKLLVAEVKPGPLQTIQGDSVKLTSDNGMVTVDGARVTSSDLKADNGVIQIIDKVILP
ncbi:fasciclin domain-containing protein [Actimicrobium sp. CCI2.3]|uniref:fasciclin domain-containing protein n=1 Tax=Actimicrobium sp. CCI2.3 TaxID=3048616 RepID=UPI002AB42755|nr:fasciclin domain-containing protein [Actimicrobium sp. CCI2.3]MDY7574265.1 fasciclin domain-containing protein [Actimicrobium sp. CCI2.3]MEB0022735.1 fasciclin domain-containing protein [Actimicrobium sp. CCI2.3]